MRVGARARFVPAPSPRSRKNATSGMSTPRTRQRMPRTPVALARGTDRSTSSRLTASLASTIPGESLARSLTRRAGKRFLDFRNMRRTASCRCFAVCGSKHAPRIFGISQTSGRRSRPVSVVARITGLPLALMVSTNWNSLSRAAERPRNSSSWSTNRASHRASKARRNVGNVASKI